MRTSLILTGLLIGCLLVLPLSTLAQPQRGQVTRPARPAASGKYYALLIGVQRYQHPSFNSLDYPLSDVRRVEQVLKTQYTFEPSEVSVLADPDRETILTALAQLAESLKADDNLLIFYAGHG